MAFHNTPAERQIIKLLEKSGLPEEETKAWVEQIQLIGMTEELTEKVQERMSHPADADAQVRNRSVQLVEFNRLVRQWRMEQGAKKFAK